MTAEVARKIESFIPLIDENRFQDIYNELSAKGSLWRSSNLMGEFTTAFIESDIDLLNYMENIPRCFCYCGESDKGPFVINIPDNIKSIGDSCFSVCSYVNKVIFSSSSPITTISYGSFSHMNKLTEVILPPNLEIIEESAFHGSDKLQKVSTLPISLTVIGTDAFRHCFKLTSITYEGTKKQFQMIEKKPRWRYRSIKQVICSDGIIKY